MPRRITGILRNLQWSTLRTALLPYACAVATLNKASQMEHTVCAILRNSSPPRPRTRNAGKHAALSMLH